MGVTSGLRRPAACPVALSGARRHAALRAHSARGRKTLRPQVSLKAEPGVTDATAWLSAAVRRALSQALGTPGRRTKFLPLSRVPPRDGGERTAGPGG